MSFYSDLAQRLTSQRDPHWIVGPLIAVVTAWIVGKSIAGMKFGLPMILLAAAIFLLVFFRRHSIVFLFPLVLALPNIGLDIPGPWAITLEDAFVLLVFGGYLTRSILRRRFIIPRDDHIARGLLLFNGMAIICIIKVAMVSPGNIIFNTKELLRLTELVMFYMAMIDALDSKQQVMRLVKWLLICVVWMMMVSFWIYLTHSPFWYKLLTMVPAHIYLKHKLLRMVSIAGSTSYTGIYYALMLALAAHYLPLFKQKMQRMAGTFLVGAIFICIVLTFNRGTWVGMLFGLTVMILHGQVDWRRVILSGALITGMIALMTTSIFGDLDIEQKVVDFLYYSSSSAESRLIRWISSINLIIEHPFMGVGYNNYAFVYGHYSILEGIQPMYGSPHNMYVDILTGTGLIGFSLFATVIVRLWRRLRDNMRLLVDPDLKQLSRGLFLAFLFFLGSGGFDSFLFKPHHSSYLIVAVWAMGTAIYRMRTGIINDPSVTSPNSTPQPQSTPEVRR